jgi:hypothetical protein
VDLEFNDFVEGIPGDTRGYVIDQPSFVLSFDTPVDVGSPDNVVMEIDFTHMTIAPGVPVGLQSISVELIDNGPHARLGGRSTRVTGSPASPRLPDSF